MTINIDELKDECKVTGIKLFVIDEDTDFDKLPSLEELFGLNGD